MAGHSAHQSHESVQDSGHASEPESTGHRHEQPEDWGWHAEMGGISRVVAVLVAAVLVLMITSNHERHIEDIWLIGIAVLILGTLGWDRRRRKNAWRE